MVLHESQQVQIETFDRDLIPQINYFPHLYQDTSGAVLKIAGFLNISLSDEALDRIVSNASVATMKTTFFVNGEGTFGEKTTHGKIGIPHIIRKGIIY